MLYHTHENLADQKKKKELHRRDKLTIINHINQKLTIIVMGKKGARLLTGSILSCGRRLAETLIFLLGSGETFTISQNGDLRGPRSKGNKCPPKKILYGII